MTKFPRGRLWVEGVELLDIVLRPRIPEVGDGCGGVIARDPLEDVRLALADGEALARSEVDGDRAPGNRGRGLRALPFLVGSTIVIVGGLVYPEPPHSGRMPMLAMEPFGPKLICPLAVTPPSMSGAEIIT